MTAKLTLGLIEVGLPPEDFNNRYGSYPSMFKSLLNELSDDFQFRDYAVLSGEIPQQACECDAWLITGSKHGVYEDHPWIEPLSELIRSAHQADIPMIGICFGHQLISQALGGVVAKSDKGWALGVNNYQLVANKPWMKGAEQEFSMQAYHQDQVLELPAGTEVIASSEFCPYAALNFADRAISFQAHPEFSAEYTRALLSNRMSQGMLPEQQTQQALEVLDQPNQRQLVGSWMASFLRYKLLNS